MTKYVVLRMLSSRLQDGVSPAVIGMEHIRDVLARRLSVYGNMVAYTSPSDVDAEVARLVAELDYILLSALDKSSHPPHFKEKIYRERCIRVEGDKITVNQACMRPLTRLVDVIIRRLDRLTEKHDVSFSGAVIRYARRSINMGQVSLR